MQKLTRQQYNQFLKDQAQLNGVESAAEKFAIEPSVQQRLETKIQESSEMLKRITRSVKDIESMNEQIACAAEQQSSAGEEISRNVTNVRDISDQTAAASEETASSSMELARIGVRLQEMTARFKV